MVLQDLLELTHFVTRLKLAPEAGAADPLEEGERGRARPLAAALAMPVLARAWQMLLKGLEEVQAAPAPAPAAQMVLIRLAYVADLPVPADLVRALGAGAATAAAPLPTRPPAAFPPSHAGEGRRGGSGGEASAASAVPGGAPSALAVAPQTVPVDPPPPTAVFDPMPQSFAEVVELFDRKREALLRAHLWSHVHLVGFQPGRIEFRKEAGAPANRVSQLLGEWTGTRWLVAYSEAAGAPTLAEAEARRAGALRNEVAAHPLVRAVLEAFPGATIAAVRERFAAPDAADAGDEAADDEISSGEDGP
jgi:DNA polymerase-3 subunit gamma/tau